MRKYEPANQVIDPEGLKYVSYSKLFASFIPARLSLATVSVDNKFNLYSPVWSAVPLFQETNLAKGSNYGNEVN